jgi:hypothetical protein
VRLDDHGVVDVVRARRGQSVCGTGALQHPSHRRQVLVRVQRYDPGRGPARHRNERPAAVFAAAVRPDAEPLGPDPVEAACAVQRPGRRL